MGHEREQTLHHAGGWIDPPWAKSSPPRWSPYIIFLSDSITDDHWDYELVPRDNSRESVSGFNK